MKKRIRSEVWRRPGNPGLRLRIKRIASRLCQMELGYRAGIRQDKISRFECGWEVPNPRERAALAVALGLSEEEVFDSEAEFSGVPSVKDHGK